MRARVRRRVGSACAPSSTSRSTSTGSARSCARPWRREGPRVEEVVAMTETMTMHPVVQVLLTVAFALVAGWAAARLLGLYTTRPLFCGLVGMEGGAWLWSAGGWETGPAIAGTAVLPLFVGALAVSAFVKLFELGAEGPRW